MHNYILKKSLEDHVLEFPWRGDTPGCLGSIPGRGVGDGGGDNFVLVWTYQTYKGLSINNISQQGEGGSGKN
jgi:hypothetical protein